MSDRPEYRINFAIERRLPGEEHFAEIGFGSTGASESLDGCAYELESTVQNRQWETEQGQPDPSEVDRTPEGTDTPAGPCRWKATCDRDAVTFVANPALGPVPACQECSDLAARLHEAGATA